MSDVQRAFRGFLDILLLRKISSEAELFLKLALATIPVMLFGLITDTMNLIQVSTFMVGWSSIIGGCFLYLADSVTRSKKTMDDITYVQAFCGWGLFQALALIPGMSRSGACITFGLLAHYTRQETVRFTFLLSIPSICAASIYRGFQIFMTPFNLVMVKDLLIGIIVAFVVGTLMLRLILIWLQRYSFAPFAYYRILLGLALIAFSA